MKKPGPLVALAAPALFFLASAATGQPSQAPASPGPPLHLSADRMTGSHTPEGDIVLLHGNVRIMRGGTVITSESGRYVRADSMLYLDGKVRMVDSTTTITCDHASYSENSDVLELQGNVTAVDREATLRAPAATYDRRLGRADLWGGVDGRDRKQHILSDRAAYFRDSLLLQARGNVRGIDEQNRLELDAAAVDYDRANHEALATGDPVLRARDDKNRLTSIRALRLRLNTETRLAEAIDSVRVRRDSLQAAGDYGLFDDRANRGWLLGHPRAWDNETHVGGDTLEMWTRERELERVVVRRNAVMDYAGSRSGSPGETNRLTGDRVDVFFAGEDIDSLVATGKANNLYEGAPQPGKTTERNLAAGDTITVFFKDRKIDHARVEGKASGEYHLAADLSDTTEAAKEVVQYDAARIEYAVGRSKIVLDPAAHLVYRDLALTARHVEYDVDHQTLVANGDPELVDRGEKVAGHLMTYDLESRVGNIYKAETAYEKGLYRGERIRKANEKELDVMNGAYSTCDLADPHYHFAAHWMKIYLKDKLVAKPVVFYVGHVPVLALPFWIFPIKPGRHSGFLLPQVDFGFSNRAGQFFRNAGYYWAPNDYMDLTLSGDYYQFEPSWVVRADGLYKLLYVLDGSFRGSFARNDRTGTEDWDFTADHSQEVTPRTRLVARASFVSSRDYNSSDLFGRSLSQRLNRFLTSSVAVSHTADWASVNAVVERREDLDADAELEDPDGPGPLKGPAPGTQAGLANLTESLPSLSIAFPTRTIGSLGFLKGTFLEKRLSTLYFSLDSRYLSYRERRGFATGPDTASAIDHHVLTRRGFASNSALSDSRRLFGWLNVRPSLQGEVAVFDFDELGHRLVPTGTWSSALTTSATFYGTFRPNLGPIQGLRHILFPSVALAYSPEFPQLTYFDAQGVKQNRFRGFGGIDVSGFRRFRMDFGLDQRLQMKLGRGDKVRKLDNLLSWTLGGSYDFLYREENLRHPLSNISSNVLLQPPGLVSASLSWVTDVYSPRPVRSLGYNMGFNLASSGRRRAAAPDLPIDRTTTPIEGEEEFRDSWSLDMAYSYSGGYPFAGTRWSSSQTANAVMHYQLTPAWGLDYSASYDVTSHQIGTQRFALTRDLHCWQAVFTRTFAPGGEAEYYFRLGVKEQKEIYFERGTRSGSIGGIQ